MRNAAVVIIVIILFFNAVMYSYWVAQEEGPGWRPSDGDDIVTPIDAIEVTVPPIRAGDILHYDYVFFGEVYGKNKTSGGWWRMTLEANGQMVEQMGGAAPVRDGYNQPHDAWSMHIDLTLSVRITVNSYDPEQDTEPLIVTGRLEGGQERYSTIRGDIPIHSYAGGRLSVDEVSGLDLPVDNFHFDVDNWAYPDPHEEPERSLEERIYGQGAVLNESMNGSYGEPNDLFGYVFTQWYNWSFDRSERVRGHDCLRLNITMDFFGWTTLDKLVWLSSDVPRPVRVKYNSTTRWDDPNETGHILLDTDQVLIRDGYTRGGPVIPIDRNGMETFVDRHPSGDFRSWEFAPEDGTLGSTSFDLGLEEAVDHAFRNDPGLQEWQETHPSPLLIDASYSSNQTDQRTTNYIWNLSFGDEAKDWENVEDWGPTNAYAVNVTKRVETRLIGEDEVTVFIDGEPTTHGDYARVPEEHMAPELLTLASSEEIWGSMSRVASEAYSGQERNVDFTDAKYFYVLGGLEIYGGFGIDLLDTMTGITVPNANVTFSLQVGGVWESGDSFMAVVDAESGRMVVVNKIKGPQSLEFLFSMLGDE